jgi:hypothetical protein
VLKETIINSGKAVLELGIAINMQKTIYTEGAKRPSKLRMLKVDDEELARVAEFKYLGSAITEQSKIIIAIKQETVTENGCS